MARRRRASSTSGLSPPSGNCRIGRCTSGAARCLPRAAVFLLRRSGGRRDAIAAAKATGVGFDLLEALRGRDCGAARTPAGSGGREPARGLAAHPSRGGGRARRVPGRAGSPRGAGGSGRAGQGAGGHASSESGPKTGSILGLATAKRCGALVQLAAESYDDDAAAALAQAAADYGALGLRLDAARSLLSLGRAQRRSKKRAAARSSLEQSAATFDQMLLRVDRAGALGACARRSAPPARGRRADADRVARGRAGGGRPLQQADRKVAVRQRAHDRGSPLARLRQARCRLACAARGAPLRSHVAALLSSVTVPSPLTRPLP